MSLKWKLIVKEFRWLLPIDCGLLDVPTNGSVTYSNSATTYEEVATFSCDPGFSLVGPLKRTCNDDGSWGDSSPICQIKGK